MGESSKCSVGTAKEENCHKLSYVKTIGLTNFNHLDDKEKKIINKRSEIKELISTICDHHKYLLMVKYPQYQYKCCDPFNAHKKSIKGTFPFIKINWYNYKYNYIEH